MKTLSLLPILALSASALPQPVFFEQNRGQAPGSTQYLSRAANRQLHLSRSGVRWAGPNLDVRMHFGDMQRLTATQPLPGVSNYLAGADPSKWLRGVPHFGRVRYEGVFPGIDAEFYPREASWEYDFLVAPGADPSAIRLDFDGADRIEIDSFGDLLAGGVRHKRPIAYQQKNGKRVLVESHFTLWSRNQARFVIGEYDRALPLVIDPTTVMSRVVGGSSSELFKDVALAGSHLIAVGDTYSADIATSNAFQTTPSTLGNAFVAKMTQAGTLVYVTYFSGSGGSQAYKVAADILTGISCVAGQAGVGLPTTPGAAKTTLSGTHPDAFVAKLDANGFPLFATYWGGSSWDRAEAVAIEAGNCWIGGITSSSDFVKVPNSGPGLQGNADAFIAKFNAPAGTVAHSKMIGGTSLEIFRSMKVLSSPTRLFLTGDTFSTDFPLLTPFRAQKESTSTADAFVMRIDVSAATNQLVTRFSSYLGGSGNEYGNAIDADNNGNMYVGGATLSTDLVGALNSNAGMYDGFVAKINSNYTLAWSRYVGGSADDDVMDLALTSSTQLAVVGGTASPNIDPQSSKVLLGGSRDAFLVQLTSAGTPSGYEYLGKLDGYGPSGYDVAWGVALLGISPLKIAVVGVTNSPDFYTTTGPVPISDAFVIIRQY
ncbi:MAG: hypothetical protein JST93_05620 [Acidobacteria bacterium]|nr:hypothetical protein [Acidobacteriota bacterium]